MGARRERLAARRAAVRRIVRPLQDFTHTEASGGIVLLLAALVALAWANSPWSERYEELLAARLTVDVGFYELSKPFLLWVNDGAMTLFFFVVGLEIKREVTIGELRSASRLALPAFGALGGVILPAAIFVLVVRDAELAAGWGIPIATDIAFALGVLALVGPRVPTGLKALLLGIAIIDDITAILVIAVFYTDAIVWAPLAVALLMLALAWAAQQLGIWYVPLYVALGVVAWAAVVKSGVHPTIVGVAFGLLTPWRAWLRPDEYPTMVERLLYRDGRGQRDGPAVRGELGRDALLSLRRLASDAVAPLDRLEHELHLWVAFLVVPLFAFANAGVSLSGDALSDALGGGLAWGILAGLVAGKAFGITGGVWAASRLGAPLPAGVGWLAVFGLALLGGIGFTVSLFITELAFAEEALLQQAKIGILAASLIAGVLGYTVLRLVHAGGRAEPATGAR